MVRRKGAPRRTRNGNDFAPIPFELIAPYNDSVKLLGSWNDWTPLPMQKDERGIWRAEVELADGDYEYKFEVVSKSFFAVGQTLYVGDPTGIEHTLDSHENSILRVRNGQRQLLSYEWQHDGNALPGDDQLVIYEMHVGDFRGGPGDSQEQPGTFQSVVEKLDYLVDLGVNAIELMPVNEFPGETAWGYSQRSIYAVENSYGTPDDLARLIDECHARGIRVIHDTVYNHMEQEAHLTRIDYGYWFYEDNPDEAHLHFGPKFNYEHHDTNFDRWPAREHVIGALRMWISLFHMDGIRFDCTRALRYFDLLRWFNDEAQRLEGFKPFYTIAEHIPQDPAIAGPGAPVEAAWHDNFYRQLNATTVGVPFDGRDPFDTHEILRVLDGRADGFSAPSATVHYLTNHDQPRTMYLLGMAANTFDDAAFRRAKLGATLLLTAPGVPMIWMGEEFGQPTEKIMARMPLQWALLGNERNQGLFNHYKHLIALRKGNPALCGPNYQPVLNIPERGLLGFKRWNDGGNVVVVVANVKPAFGGDFEIADAGLEDGTWREVVFGYDVQVQDGRLHDNLAESEAKIYIRSA
jgi:1,4-alpha-glucan branching enzyme